MHRIITLLIVVTHLTARETEEVYDLATSSQDFIELRVGEQTYLISGDTDEHIPVSTFVNRNANFLAFVLPLPQLTFTYQLRRNWSLNLGLGGASGMGATYTIAGAR